MRVAIVYRLDSPGGVQSCIISLIRGLNQKGIVPDILWDEEPNWDLLKNVEIKAAYRPVHFVIPSVRIDRLPTSIRYIAWLANTIQGDRFQKDYDFFYIFYNGFLTSQGMHHIRYLPGPPLLPQLEGSSPGLRGVPSRFFRWVYKRVLYKVRPVYEVHPNGRYVTISYYTAELFEEAHNIRLPIIHPPIDLKGHSFDFGDLVSRDTLTFFSRIIPYKRPEMVLKLASRYPNMRCLIMGGVPEHRLPYFQDLKELARELLISGVVFLANPSDEQAKAELARTRYYVFPAINEHFGMTTAEAIASGAVPFVHDSGGQKEIVPYSALRFTDQNFLHKFDALVHLPLTSLNEIRKMLYPHIQQYSEEIFIAKMLAFLDSEYAPDTQRLIAQSLP